jgi:magnesium transporter
MRNIFPGAGGTLPLWIDLYDPTSAEAKEVETETGLRVPSRAELDEIETSSRLQAHSGAVYLSMPVSVHRDVDHQDWTPIGFVLSPKILVTVRYVELPSWQSARREFDSDIATCTSSTIFVNLLEAMVDFSADALEHIGAQLNEVSRQVFCKRTGRSTANSNRLLQGILLTVGNAGERLSHIRQSLLGLQRIIPFTTDKAKSWIGADIEARLKVASADLQSLSDFEAHLSGKVQFLLDAVLGFINTDQNDIFKVLTIVSVVGIPPTFIASLYGMNFHNMPEYGWTYGYQWGLGLIFLSTILPVLWFKWRGWW